MANIRGSGVSQDNHNVNIQDQSLALGITVSDTPVIDGFGRLRVSNPNTVFDSKQLYNNVPLLWSDNVVSGAGTTSTFSEDRASTTLGVSANTAGYIVRQTRRRFNYQPGKGQLIFMTGVLGAKLNDIRRAFGLFDEQNGIFLQLDNLTLSLNLRSYVTGSAVTTSIAQANWNLDTFDGTGTSGYTLDVTKAQILVVDYEWLGVGRVRCGFVIDGIIHYAHEFLHANIINSVYMSTPNLPCRYELQSGGSNTSAGTLEHICVSVISEGGVDPGTLTFSINNGGTPVRANTVDTYYALLGIKLNNKNAQIDLTAATIALFNQTVGVLWELRLNPTVADTFAYAALTGSGVDVAYGNKDNPSLNTVTEGTVLASGYVERGGSIAVSLANKYRLGYSAAGVADTLVLCVTPTATNAQVAGSLTFGEV